MENQTVKWPSFEGARDITHDLEFIEFKILLDIYKRAADIHRWAEYLESQGTSFEPNEIIGTLLQRPYPAIDIYKNGTLIARYPWSQQDSQKYGGPKGSG